MGLFLLYTALEILLGLLLVVWSFYFYLTRHYHYWAKRGIPFKRPVFPYGSLKDLTAGKKFLGLAYNEVYKEFPNERFVGVVELHRPILLVRDPDLVKQIMMKDFNHFVDRHPFDTNPRETMSHSNLFTMGGKEGWKNMRQKLTPAFSSGKMKNMFLLVKKCSDQLGDYLEKEVETHSEIDVKNVLAKFTMDIIATCAFGLEINSLEDSNTSFFKTGTSIFKPNRKQLIKYKILSIFPGLAEIFNIFRLEENHRQLIRDIVTSTVNHREENNVTRNDFLDILIKLKNNKSILDGTEDQKETRNDPKDYQKEGLTLDEMMAQSFIFFIAGFETSSSTMTHCLYELGLNQDAQERLSREVEEVLQQHDGEVNYQALQEMKYMDQVINETLRMYASLPILHRRCTQPYRIPDTDVVLEKGQKVYIPIYALHHDPQYYPEPFKFDPERFSPENVRTRHPFVHLPFGDGPRNCIGMRFGLMQTKMGLITVLSRFRVEVCPETPVPIQALPTALVTVPSKPVVLSFTRRT